MTELLTERLRLRPFRSGDFEAHAEICADAEVMKHIRAGALSRADAWWQLARYMGHWQLRGYGLWAVVERATERLVGHLGFLEPEGAHGFEMGWALARSAWGKGYALEGTRAAIHHAFTALDRDRIVCVITPDNARSIRLAERLGARREGELEESGRRLLVFAITRPAGPAAAEPRGPDVRREIFGAAPFISSVGIRLESVGPGECHTSLRLRPEHLQQTGVVHAGVLATMADHTAGGAAASVLEAGSYPLSVEFKINLLRAATGDRLACHARVLKAGRTLIVAESEVMAGAGTDEVLVAKATVTLAVRTKERTT